MISLLLMAYAWISRNRNSGAATLTILFFLITNGAQILPAESLTWPFPIEKPYDYALVLMFALAVESGLQSGKIRVNDSVGAVATIFLCFLAVSAAYGIFADLNTSKNTLQVGRSYCGIVAIFAVRRYSRRQFEALFLAIVATTIGLCFLYLLQPLYGAELINSRTGSGEVVMKMEDAGARFYNTPIFLPVSIFLLVCYWRSIDAPFLKPISLLILVAALLVSQHRGYALGILFSVVVVSGIRGGAKGWVLLAVAAVVAITAVQISEVLRNRLSDGFVDLVETIDLVGVEDDQVVYKNTTLFRITHFSERLDLILDSTRTIIFGVGLMSDNSPNAYLLPLRFGLVSDGSREIIKIDTADITWSLVILQLGVVGTAILTYLYVAVVRRMVNYKIDPAARAAQMLVVQWLFSSFTSTEPIELHSQALIAVLVTSVTQLWHPKNSAG
jgi:hypothetical protein